MASIPEMHTRLIVTAGTVSGISASRAPTRLTFTLNGISKSWDVGNMNADKMSSNVNKTF